MGRTVPPNIMVPRKILANKACRKLIPCLGPMYARTACSRGNFYAQSTCRRETYLRIIIGTFLSSRKYLSRTCCRQQRSRRIQHPYWGLSRPRFGVIGKRACGHLVTW